jgi:hypothetical protein
MLIAGGTAFAQPVEAFNVQKASFALTLPDGWVEIPENVLASTRDEVARQAPNANIRKPSFGFQLKSAPQDSITYPYILVSLNEAGRIPEKQLKAMPEYDFHKTIDKTVVNLKSMLTAGSLGKVQYDPVAHIVWMPTVVEAPEVGEIIGLTGLIPTESGFIQIDTYCLGSAGQTFIPTFYTIITSARIPEKNTYKPHWSDNVPPDRPVSFIKVTDDGLLKAAITGALLALFSGIGLKLRKNRSR